MKFFILLLALMCYGWEARTGDRDFDSYLKDLNVSAHTDGSKFHVGINAQFGNESEPMVRRVERREIEPADAYMIMETSRECHRPPEEVYVIYKRHHRNGWGRVARECGVDPRSKHWKNREYRVHDDNEDRHEHKHHKH